MPTPGAIAAFGSGGNLVDSIITEDAVGITVNTGASPVLYTGTGTSELNRYLQLINSTNVTSASGLKAGGVLVGDSYSYANPGKNDLIVKGNVGIGTSSPATPLHVTGNLTLDPGSSPVLFTGTGSSEQNRYLQLINSPHSTSASGLKAGGILVADSYSFANPGKNDLIVKGSVSVGGGIALANSKVVLEQDVANAGFIALLGTGGAQMVHMSSVIGAPDNGFIAVTDAASAGTGAFRAAMAVDANGQGTIVADVKNFRAPHPTQPNMEIVYACIEGPEAAVYLRGTAHLTDGGATISLPDHFVGVAVPESMTTQLTPLSAASLGLAVVGKHVSSIDVRELHGGAGNYDFDWEVKCVRKGYETYQVIRPQNEMIRPAARI
jgi:hypothetical protein